MLRGVISGLSTVRGHEHDLKQWSNFCNQMSKSLNFCGESFSFKVDQLPVDRVRRMKIFWKNVAFSTNSSPTVKHAIRVTQESFGATNLEKDLGQRNFIQDKKWLKKIRYKLKEWMNWEIDRSWCKNFYLKLLKSLKKTRALWLLNGAPPPCKLQHWL